MQNDTICVHAFVSGRVQGVWFRAFTRQKALEEDVCGWANNLQDGRVEVMLSGHQEAIESVMRALQEGPELARVDDIVRETLPPQDFEGFRCG